jgi:hypothetical protein
LWWKCYNVKRKLCEEKGQMCCLTNGRLLLGGNTASAKMSEEGKFMFQNTEDISSEGGLQKPFILIRGWVVNHIMGGWVVWAWQL